MAHATQPVDPESALMAAHSMLGHDGHASWVSSSTTVKFFIPRTSAVRSNTKSIDQT